MSNQEHLAYSSFDEMIRNVRDNIRVRHPEPRSIHSRLKIVSGDNDLKIEIRDSHGTPNGITVSERPTPEDSWRRTTINLVLLSAQGEVQLSLPSDGLHPRGHLFIESIDQLPEATSELFARGLSLL